MKSFYRVTASLITWRGISQAAFLGVRSVVLRPGVAIVVAVLVSIGCGIPASIDARSASDLIEPNVRTVFNFSSFVE